MDVVEKLASAGHLTEEQKDDVLSTIEEFMKLAQQDPEFHAEAMEKVGAPFGDMLMNTGKMLGATALVAGAANVIGDLYDTAKDAINKSRYYKAMMDVNPELKEHDSTAVQRVFGTLHKFNPQYASDPTVAGEFVAQRMRQQGMDFNQLKSIVDAGKALRPSRQSALQYVTTPSIVAQHMVMPGSEEALKQRHGEDMRREEMRQARYRTALERQQLVRGMQGE